MPRTVDYPGASLRKALETANAVDYLGGKCSLETCADKMGMSIGGGFKAVISAAVKFNLIEVHKGNLSTTELYKLIKYSYDESEKIDNYRKAFLSAPIFNNIYERFKGRELPVMLLDRILIREFDIDESLASRIKKYFLEGAKFINILDEKNILLPINVDENNTTEIIQTEIENANERNIENSPTSIKQSFDNYIVLSDNNKEYTVHIKGPDIDSRIIINEVEDLDIVNVMLNKLRKKVNQHEHKK